MEKSIQSFSDISEVYYYIGSSKKKTLYKAGTSKIDFPEFVETDFKYFQAKTGFTDSSTLGLLDTVDKNIINSTRLNGIEKYLFTLFPTVIPGESIDNSIEYFSSYIDYNGTEIFCFIIPEDITRVEMVEDGIESPVVTVDFSTSESVFSKILWLVTTYNKEDPMSINLSWTSYKTDKVSNSKMSDYVLRNDSLVSGYSGVHEENGFMISSISGTLSGTTKLTKRPLYDLLSSYIGSDWNKRARYSIGDRVKVGENWYKSVEPNNIGNHPYYSRYWIKVRI